MNLCVLQCTLTDISQLKTHIHTNWWLRWSTYVHERLLILHFLYLHRAFWQQEYCDLFHHHHLTMNWIVFSKSNGRRRKRKITSYIYNRYKFDYLFQFVLYLYSCVHLRKIYLCEIIYSIQWFLFFPHVEITNV